MALLALATAARTAVGVETALDPAPLPAPNLMALRTSPLISTDRPAITHLQRAFVDHFGFHEPIYFLYGPNEPAAKFQFSLRYRLVGRTPSPDQMEPPARALYLGYTQRSLWDIEGDSSPFYDSSYMPEVMFESLAPDRSGEVGWFHWLGFQAGVKHESNGQGGDESRSLNIVYFRPGLAIGSLEGWRLVLAPRFFAYLGTSDYNDDIADYRGYGEMMLIFGRNDGLMIQTTGVLGRGWEHGSIQIDVSHPISIPRLKFSTFLHLQYFDGYGESLLDYNQKSSTWRAGFSIVR